MRAKFVTLNLVALALGLAGWRAGFFAVVADFNWRELALLASVGVYASAGFVAVLFGRWSLARHIAHGAPMWALGCTGIAMLGAVNGMHTLTPSAMAEVFRELAFSIAPNILGVLAMAWIRELVWWCGGEEI